MAFNEASGEWDDIPENPGVDLVECPACGAWKEREGDCPNHSCAGKEKGGIEWPGDVE